MYIAKENYKSFTIAFVMTDIPRNKWIGKKLWYSTPEQMDWKDDKKVKTKRRTKQQEKK